MDGDIAGLWTGPAKTVEFEFDLGEDTAASVACEMVEEMALSQDDAHSIASAIKKEVRLLTGLGSPMPSDGFPEGFASSKGAAVGKAVPSLGSSPLSPGSCADAIPASSSGGIPRSDSMRSLLERQQQQAQQQEEQEPGKVQLAPQSRAGALEPLANGVVDEKVLSEGLEDTGHHRLHTRALSRLLSPPKEELTKLNIQDLFAQAEVSYLLCHAAGPPYRYATGRHHL